MTRVYIAGPMTGIPQMNYPAFAAEAARLRALGHDVVSPHELNEGLEHEGWVACMKRDLQELLRCDSIQLLTGWGKSRGALIEARLAGELGITVHEPFVATEEIAA